MKDLTDHIAIVTGAGRGIGRATAVALAQKGCHLVLNDLEPEPVSEVQAEIRGMGRQAITVCADMSTMAAARQLIDAATEQFGQVDILVNNAGFAVAGFIDTVPENEWHHIMDVNFWGYVFTTQAVLPEMMARGSGHLVYLSSISGLVASANTVAYSTTKFAVASLAESVAAYTRPYGLGVSLICPGTTATGIDFRTHYCFHDQAEQGHAKSQLRKVIGRGKPVETVSSRIVRAIEKNQFMVYTNWYMRWLPLIRILSPRLYGWGNAKVSDYMFNGRLPDAPPLETPPLSIQK